MRKDVPLNTKKFMKRMVYYLMALLGFGVQGCDKIDGGGGEVCMYGTPVVEFHLSARVVDSEGNPIEGIEVRTKYGAGFDSKTGFSDYQGNIDAYTRYAHPGSFNELIFLDVDGEANGGEFAELTLNIADKLVQVEEGDGAWNMGGYKAELGDVVMSLKDGSEDENLVEASCWVNFSAVVVDEAGEPIQGIHAYPEGGEFAGREGYSDYLGRITTYSKLSTVQGKFIIHFEDVDEEYNGGVFDSVSVDITDKVASSVATGAADVVLESVVMKRR